MIDFTNKIVKKPWGKEYLLYENDNIALWHLTIKQGFETSLHSHPNKKTGLIVVFGGAKVSFLNNSYNFFPLDKIMIRPGVFHKTKAIVGDVELIEIESPKDKLDIVRLEDNYGRAGQPYEDNSHYTESNIRTLQENDIFKIGNCNGWFGNMNLNNDINDEYIFLILGGQITSNNFPVVGPGDIINGKNLKLMRDKFEYSNLQVLALTNGTL